MSEAGVAFRYAKPLLELAVEKGLEDAVNDDMKLLKDACEANRELLAVLRNPVIRGFKKFGILKALFADKITPLTLSLFEIMTSKNREDVLFSVSKEFNKLYNTHKGIEEVLLTTSIALPAKLKKALEKKLSDSLKKTVLLEEKIDPSLIGGLIVQVGNSQIDNSIKHSLSRLKNSFGRTLQN